MNAKFYCDYEYTIAKQRVKDAQQQLDDLKAAGKRTTQARKELEAAQQALREAPEPKASALWLASELEARLNDLIAEGQAATEKFFGAVQKKGLYGLKCEFEDYVRAQIKANFAQRILDRSTNRRLTEMLHEIQKVKDDARKQLLDYSRSVSTDVLTNTLAHYERATFSDLLDENRLTGFFGEQIVYHYADRNLIVWDEHYGKELPVS